MGQGQSTQDMCSGCLVQCQDLLVFPKRITPFLAPSGKKEALKTKRGGLLAQGLVIGVRALGDLFREGQAFLPEVMISTRAMNLGLAELEPHLREADVPRKGTVVLGTVEGDLHDIGKNLVGMMLEGGGYHILLREIAGKEKLRFEG